MRSRYDFARMKGRKSPYVKLLKQSITIRLDRDTVAYFKAMAGDTGLPYQHLINLYLRDCVAEGRRPSTEWGAISVAEPQGDYQPEGGPARGRRRDRKQSADEIAKTPEYKALLAELKEIIDAARASGLIKPGGGKRPQGRKRPRAGHSR